MAVPTEEVRRIAALARIRLSNDELRRTAEELEKILEYVRQLDELDTSDIPPTTHVHAGETTLRSDTPIQRTTVDEGLENAPDTDGVYFRVPGVIE